MEMQSILLKLLSLRTFLAVQWLRLHVRNAGSMDLIPDWGTKTPTCCTAWPKKENKNQIPKKKKPSKKISNCFPFASSILQLGLYIVFFVIIHVDKLQLKRAFIQFKNKTENGILHLIELQTLRLPW